MYIHEWQAKALLKEYGLTVQEGYASSCVVELRKAADKIGGGLWCVKAQIFAGGRGKGSFVGSDTKGIVLAHSASEVQNIATQMIGRRLVTKQTSARGEQVRFVYVEKGCDSIVGEFYLSILIDRTIAMPVFVISSAGGVDIEEAVQKEPDKVIRFPVYPEIGVRLYHGRMMAIALDLGMQRASECYKLLLALYRLFTEKDCELIEINPLCLTSKGEMVCLDCKMIFDDNALYRQQDIVALREVCEEENLTKSKADRLGMSYIALDGDIGCIVNGAGLAMATMDIIKADGGDPANFLDIGGGASEQVVYEALNIITMDKKVRGILINVFGGIVKCDLVAQGVIDFANTKGISIPVVVRMVGTNADQGRKLLLDAGLNISVADSLSEASRFIVEATRSGST